HDEGDRWVGLAEAQVAQLQRKDELLGVFYSKRSALRSDESSYEDALADSNRALEIEQRVFGPDHLSVAEIYCRLGSLELLRAHPSKALDAYQRCLAIRQRALGPDHPMLVSALVNVADVYGDRGEHERAIAEFRRALATLQRVQPEHPLVTSIY